MYKNIFILLITLYTSQQLFAENIQILSAVKKDKTIKNAEVILQKSGKTSKVTHSKSNGNAIFNGFGDTQESTLIIKKEGYSTLVAQCPCDGLTYALSPNMNNLDGMRAVLRWGKYPSDLDSHLAYKDNHIFFRSKKGEKAHLDVDDTDSYGPETVTILHRQEGKAYIYAVHDYSNGQRNSTKSLGKSGATVDVYIGRTLMRTYRVKPKKVGNIWVVFAIDEDGIFHDINDYLGTTKSSEGVKKIMKEILISRDFASQSTISNTDKLRAESLNDLGEQAYHKKRYETAMYKYQKAINIDPYYGQAYSNLGLVFQRLKRSAEAIWANKKAIELASGVRTKEIKASSYYNIAKVYQVKKQYQNALNAYQKALSYKEHPAYHKGIARMKKKLRR
jgi:tetratricopeptide (TPR) repeat protein